MAERAPKRPARERRRLILEGAETVFASSGYSGSDTAALARAAGVSAPALYRYFPSKRELFLATLRGTGPRLAGIWERTAEGAGDPLAAIWSFGLGYYDHVQGHSPVMKLWFQALCESDDAEVRSVLRENFLALVDGLEENIERGRSAGLVDPDVDARVAAWHFMSIGLTFDLIHLLGLAGELDRGKVERWGRMYLKSLGRENGGATGAGRPADA